MSPRRTRSPADGHCARNSETPADTLNPSRTEDTDPVGRTQPLRKAKRGKYVSKACLHCQRRKIKCDGGLKCRPCLSRGRECLRQPIAPFRATINPQLKGSTQVIGNDKETSGGVNDAVLRRLAYLESQLQRLLETQAISPVLEDATPKRRTRSSQLEHHKDVPEFIGESSITHTLHQVEDSLEEIGVTYPEPPSAPPSQPLTPSPSLPDETIPSEPAPDSVQRALIAHNIAVDRESWDQYLQSYIDEVHVLYPILHLPTLCDRYGQFWGDACDRPASYSGHDYRVQAAQMCICLAIGRCTNSPRTVTADGRHSAGWSLYSAAMEMLGDPIELLTREGSVLLALQTVALMVVYLFRLDANERAGKILALAISHAHQHGLHREKTLAQMSLFESEIFRRLWWCLYVLDRRLSLETGIPFLIQDMNVDTHLPLDVSDDWLRRYVERCERKQDLVAEVEGALGVQAPRTLIPYLVGMVHYSRVVAKVWEALYRTNGSTEGTWNPLLHDHLEHLISSAQNQAPASLTDVSDSNNAESTWWMLKQETLIHIRWTFLRLTIRSQILHRSSPRSFDAETSKLENEFACMTLAQQIFDRFNHLPDSCPKYEFPFLHYLARTAMISLGLLIRQPAFHARYGPVTLQISRALKAYTRKTWVSGKFARTVMKLSRMAETVLVSQPATTSPAQALGGIGSLVSSASGHRSSRLNPGVSGVSGVSSVSSNGRGLASGFVAPPRMGTRRRRDGVSESQLDQGECASAMFGGAQTQMHDSFLISPSAQGRAGNPVPSPISGLMDVITQDFDFEENAMQMDTGGFNSDWVQDLLGAGLQGDGFFQW